MPKKTIRDIPLEGRRVLMRVDFNVPLTEAGEVSNDLRIRSTLPTIQAVLQTGASVILMSHLGRPTGDPEVNARYAMTPVADRLERLLGRPVRRTNQVVCPHVRRTAESLRPGEVLLLENLRFHPGEKKGDDALASELAALADVYVNDAFGTCQNLDASMVAVPNKFPIGNRVIGLLVERELEVLDGLLGDPQQPMIAILGGGPKVSEKIKMVERILPRVERVLIGGAMAYTFAAAAGRDVGKSKVEPEDFDLARRLVALAGRKLVQPSDHLVADRLAVDALTEEITDRFRAEVIGVDIGRATAGNYVAEIDRAKTIVWNGPVGKFELEPFSRGTRAIAKAMADSKAVTVVGGGDTATAVEAFGVADRMTHVSTGGGAFLAYLGGEQFESLRAIDDR